MGAGQGKNLGLTYGWNDGDAYGAAMNANLEQLDTVVQLSVKAVLNTPPGSPADGDRYVVGTSPTGVWSGFANYVVAWELASSTWSHYAPKLGQTFWDESWRMLQRWDGVGWRDSQQGVNVKDWGATGNGTTDDQAAIQGAINWAASIGSYTVFPRGTYKILTTLTLPVGARLIGTNSSDVGFASWIISPNAIPLLTFPTINSPPLSDAKVFVSILIQNMWLVNGQDSINAPNGGMGVVIHNCTFETPSRACIYTKGWNEDWRISLTEFAVGQYGIYGHDPGLAQPTAYECSFVDCSVSESFFRNQTINAVHIRAKGLLHNFAIENCRINECVGTGVELDGNIRQMVFNNVYMNACGFLGAARTPPTTGSMAFGTTTITLADRTGYANGGDICVQGAFNNGQDLQTTVSSGGGTTGPGDLVLAGTAAFKVDNVEVTKYTNANIKILQTVGNPANITFIGCELAELPTAAGLRYNIDLGPLNQGTVLWLNGKLWDRPIYDANSRLMVLGDGDMLVRKPNLKRAVSALPQLLLPSDMQMSGSVYNFAGDLVGGTDRIVAWEGDVITYDDEVVLHI